MNVIDKTLLKDKEFEYKKRERNVFLVENFFFKIALTPIENKKYEVVVYSQKQYSQGSLF